MERAVAVLGFASGTWWHEGLQVGPVVMHHAKATVVVCDDQTENDTKHADTRSGHVCVLILQTSFRCNIDNG